MSDEQPLQDDERSSHNADDSEHGGRGEIRTAWQQAKDAFAKSERRYRDLVEHSLGLICTDDLAGRLQSINPAAVRSLGYETEHGIGHSLVEFLAPETGHLFGAYLQRIRDNRQDAGLMRVIARNGDERVWMYSNVLAEEPGGDPYVLGHAIDITERIAAERMLREKEHALRQAHDELERRVNERTVALEQANSRLRVEIAERQHAEDRRERALIEQTGYAGVSRGRLGGTRAGSDVRATAGGDAAFARAVRRGLDDGSRCGGRRQYSLGARRPCRPPSRRSPGGSCRRRFRPVVVRLPCRPRGFHETAHHRHRRDARSRNWLCRHGRNRSCAAAARSAKRRRPAVDRRWRADRSAFVGGGRRQPLRRLGPDHRRGPRAPEPPRARPDPALSRGAGGESPEG